MGRWLLIFGALAISGCNDAPAPVQKTASVPQAPVGRYTIMLGDKGLAEDKTRIWRLDTATGRLDTCEDMDVVSKNVTTPTVMCWKGEAP